MSAIIFLLMQQRNNKIAYLGRIITASELDITGQKTVRRQSLGVAFARTH